ncbi:MAG: hypothetical protein LBS55_00305 [Prevotellaceae bacterium]|jgi:hypothetical protein|nr:hypothetical protein [Prevotellaceae bacterium]
MILSIIITFMSVSLYSANYYVKVDGSGAGTGNNWANAMDNRSFAEKLLTAKSGDIFYLAAGTYIPYFDTLGNEAGSERTKTFLIRDGVSVQGGYNASGNPVSGNDAAIASVKLTGVFRPNSFPNSNACHVVTIASDANNASAPMLRNLTITNGYANGGGDNSKGAGIFIGTNAGANKTIELSRINVSDNHSNNDGCGIYINNNADVLIDSSLITGNTRIAFYDVWGGGISIMHAQLSIRNSKITGNTANHGGAILITGGQLLSDNCVYDNNSAGLHGGAIDMYTHSKAEFNSDVFSHNKAPEGGAIHNESRSEIKLKGCLLSENNATEGGGFYNPGDCKAEIDSCVIKQNVAQRGGGIDNRGYMTVTRSRITENAAKNGDANGGGINQRGTFIMNQCEVSHNTAKNGGGVYTENNIALISNTTISNNTATANGGGIYHRYDKCELHFVTITGNTAPNDKGSGILGISRPTVCNSIVSGNSNNDNVKGNYLYERGMGYSVNNIIGASFYLTGNRNGNDIGFNAAQHFGALAFNRDAAVKSHALTWTSVSTNNPAVGKAVFDSAYKHDQTGHNRSKRYPSLGAYEEILFKAYDDFATTNKEMYATVDILINDSYPESCTPTVTILTKSLLASNIIYSEPYLVYTPKIGVQGLDTVKYKIQCPSGYEDSAVVVVEIGIHYDNPQNIKDEATCMEDMPAVKFKAHRKIYNNKTFVDGFSSPLVGDINGDGKPEIIGLGVVNLLGGTIAGLSAAGKSIVIYDGQTGDILHNAELATIGGNKHESTYGYGTRYGFKLRSEPRHNSYSHLAIADLDNDSISEIIVAETGSGKVYALKPTIDMDNDRNILGLKKMWDADVLHKAPVEVKTYISSSVDVFGSPVPYISDLNGDGIPEVIVYNKIYNGKTGKLSLELETLRRFSDPETNNTTYNTECKNYAYVGRLASTLYNDDCMPVMAINDIDNDGVMEVIAGSKIYKPKIVNSNLAASNTYSVIRGPESVNIGGKTYYLTDGFTVVADIDGDNALDVIVVKRHTSADYFLIYVWDPRKTGNASLKAVLTVKQKSELGHFSVPFVGDINGRTDGWSKGGYNLKLPEICLTAGKLQNNDTSYHVVNHPLSNIPNYTDKQYTEDDGTGLVFYGHIVAFTYDANEPDIKKRLKLSWMMKHNDSSHQTGIVMFDFDADGINELVYRDGLSLRVISPANKADGFDFVNLKMDNTTHPDVIRFRETGVASYTGSESTVIADVNGDGSADIITFAIESNLATANSGGHLFVYEAAEGSWAPTRPVWNQGIYYPLQINDDLTVPRHPQSTLKKYHSKMPMQANGDSIQPFNGNWIQQPIVRTNNYVPIRMLSDPSISMEGIRIISSSASETQIRIKVDNRGEASANSKTPVSFYHTEIASTNKILTDILKHDIFPGDHDVSEYVLHGDFKGKIIYVRLVDDGTSFPAKDYADCDPNNNVAYTMQVTAVDDYFSLTSNNLTYLNICKNDTFSKNITPQIEIIESAKHGLSLVASDSQISYMSDPGFQGIDTIRYRIRCTDNNFTVSDEATVYILTLKPVSMEYMACPGAKIDIEINSVTNVEYNWFNVETGGNILTGGKNTNKFTIVKSTNDETLWVQATIKGFASNLFPRFKVNLPLATNCNSDKPSECMENGMLLFHEDFGGNSPSDDNIVTNGNLAQVKKYAYSDKYVINSYTIRKVSGGLSKWLNNIGDHTNPNDNSRGYMLQFYATNASGQFYECRLDDLCEGSVLNMSAWIANISKNNRPGKVNLIFKLEDSNGNVLSKYYTGSIDDNSGIWKNYGFSFSVPHKVSSLVLKIENNGSAADNNFVIDDVSVYLCVPKVSLTDNRDHKPCIGSNHEFKGTYTDDGTFGDDLMYRLQFRKNKNELWKTVVEKKETSPIDMSESVTVTAKGYYRLIVGREDIIDGENCIAISSEIFIDANDDMRFCAPKVDIADIAFDTLVCLKKTLTLKGSYPDVGNPFGNDINYRWEFRHIDSVNWKTLEQRDTTPPLNVVWQITNISKADEGYYRLRVGERGNTGDIRCCASSDSVRVNVIELSQVPDIRIQLTTKPDRVINMTKFLDSIRSASIHWDKVNFYAPEILSGTAETTGSINTGGFTGTNNYTYKYTVTSQCGSSKAIVYIRVLDNRILRNLDTIMICGTHESSKSINLNQILGLELGGVWKYDNTINPDATVSGNVTEILSPSRHEGALIFNASKAWNVAPESYSINYKNYHNAKIFRFKYYPPTGSKITKEKELVIVVTS